MESFLEALVNLRPIMLPTKRMIKKEVAIAELKLEAEYL